MKTEHDKAALEALVKAGDIESYDRYRGQSGADLLYLVFPSGRELQVIATSVEGHGCLLTTTMGAQSPRRRMPLGLYRLHWKGGGCSLAAVGQLHDGTLWFAPTNWTSVEPGGSVSTNWDLVERSEYLPPPLPEAQLAQR